MSSLKIFLACVLLVTACFAADEARILRNSAVADATLRLFVDGDIVTDFLKNADAALDLRMKASAEAPLSEKERKSLEASRSFLALAREFDLRGIHFSMAFPEGGFPTGCIAMRLGKPVDLNRLADELRKADTANSMMVQNPRNGRISLAMNMATLSSLDNGKLLLFAATASTDTLQQAITAGTVPTCPAAVRNMNMQGPFFAYLVKDNGLVQFLRIVEASLGKVNDLIGNIPESCYASVFARDKTAVLQVRVDFASEELAVKNLKSFTDAAGDVPNLTVTRTGKIVEGIWENKDGKLPFLDLKPQK